MNCKCLLGLHDWKYRTWQFRTCKVCWKKQKSRPDYGDIGYGMIWENIK